jgi:hypothetical protein
MVMQRHPDIASTMIEETSRPLEDLTKLPEYFIQYCSAIAVEPASIKGPVYKSSITEKKKVFISAMLRIYHDQHRFKTKIAEILDQKLPPTIRMIKEVQVRFAHDEDFKNSVTDILSLLHSPNNHS